MSTHAAHAFIQLQIAKMANSALPAQDRTFIEGMIEMAVLLEQLPVSDAECYREALAVKTGNRIVKLRSAA
ncbi:hypothetical protein [Pseudomonas sp. Irchel 3A18]|uniref:hypothetical protein n=1 Tax=Pseudomonas sp. Irchel 3A18 TaxID=2008905 RepID=UPI000BA323D6|nr:hypothetical protein [Pseudomonas sp. Irchel 3A18]